MQFKAFEPVKSAKEEREKVFFRLFEDKGNIDLVACEENGEKIEDGYILTIRENGLLQLAPAVSEDIGLMLGASGTLKLHPDSRIPELSSDKE